MRVRGAVSRPEFDSGISKPYYFNHRGDEMAKPIETSKLTKYYGSTRGIEEVDLEVEEGEIFGFIGPNGAGKTTTIRTLLDIIFPTSGRASIFGIDTHSDSRQVKKSAGYLPSEDYYYKQMSGRQLLAYSARIYGLPPDSYRKRIGELAEHLELNLDAKIKTLSRGNRRKVSIIRSLLPGARLLILDEPTSGLDPLMQTRFFELIKSEQEKGTTVFFSSHILSEVQRICTRVAIIKAGRIARTEKIDTLAREHLRKVTLEITPGSTIGDFSIEGAEEIERQGDTIRFLYSGGAESLLAYLVESGVNTKLKDLFIERSTLDEIFLGYYRDETEEENP